MKCPEGFKKEKKKKKPFYAYPSGILLILSAALESRELCGQIFSGTNHHAADLRVCFQAAQERRGADVGANLRNEEDGRRIAVGVSAQDVFAVADRVAEAFGGLGGRL